MKLFLIVPFIFITIQLLVLIAIVAIKVVGPNAAFPSKNEDPARNSGVAFFSYVMGGFVLFLQIRVILSKIPVLQENPMYFVDSNRLFFTLYIFACCFYLMGDILVSASRWQLSLLLTGSTVTLLLWVIGMELSDFDDVDFLIYGVEVMLGMGVLAWLLNTWALHTQLESKPTWFAPKYICGEKWQKLYHLS